MVKPGRIRRPSGGREGPTRSPPPTRPPQPFAAPQDAPPQLPWPRRSAARRSGRASTIVFRDTICLTPASAAGDRLPSRKLLPPDPYRLARRVSPYVS